MAWRPSDDDAGGATVSLRSVKEALKLTGIELSDDDDFNSSFGFPDRSHSKKPSRKIDFSTHSSLRTTRH